MPLFKYSPSALEAVERTSLAAERIRERDDLQRVLKQGIEVLGEDLLVVAEEYALFQDSRRRVDLLAIDRTGTLVVIELKRTEDGGHMDLQALRYAAMVSTMTTGQLVDTYAHYNNLDAEAARRSIADWVEDFATLEQLSNQVRIILVSADFNAEITSTVLWLNDNFSTDIRCYRLTPYRLGADVLLDIQQIIPLPEAADYQIQQRQKGAAAAASRAAREGRDFTKYDLRIGEKSWPQMSKQGAVKTALQELYRLGVPLADLQSATQVHRWVEVHPREGESVEEAFVREYPQRRPRALWFDLAIGGDATQWIMPRFGGTDTEPMLTALADVAKATIHVDWNAAVD